MIEQTERETSSSSPPPRFFLVPVWLTVEELPGAVEVGALPIVIGRVEGEGVLAIPDARISRTHATVVLSGRLPVVRDSSTNGTFADGERVSGSVSLSDGSVLRTGNTFFVVRARAASGEDADVPESLVGRSPAIALRASVALVARSAASILVLGETGTGKRRSSPARSTAARGAAVARPVNCAAIPESPRTEQLFGHVAGAFTGATTGADGVFRRGTAAPCSSLTRSAEAAGACSGASCRACSPPERSVRLPPRSRAPRRDHASRRGDEPRTSAATVIAGRLPRPTCYARLGDLTRIGLHRCGHRRGGRDRTGRATSSDACSAR